MEEDQADDEAMKQDSDQDRDSVSEDQVAAVSSGSSSSSSTPSSLFGGVCGSSDSDEEWREVRPPPLKRRASRKQQQQRKAQNAADSSMSSMEEEDAQSKEKDSIIAKEKMEDEDEEEEDAEKLHSQMEQILVDSNSTFQQMSPQLETPLYTSEPELTEEQQQEEPTEPCVIAASTATSPADEEHGFAQMPADPLPSFEYAAPFDDYLAQAEAAASVNSSSLLDFGHPTFGDDDASAPSSFSF